MTVNFTFEESHFNRIFPFYILINDQMVIESAGTTLQKLFMDVITGKNVKDYFKITSPRSAIISIESFKGLSNRLLVIECNNIKLTSLRGQIDYLPGTNQFLFIGSPAFSSIEEVNSNNLSLQDFAHHDSMSDLLRGIKVHETANKDLKYLLRVVERQKNELKTANAAINDIALFSTQNPDPLIRINYQGDVIQNNPAASRLDFLEYEGKRYRNDDFFKLIATNIDSTEPRWTIEARSAGTDYSFVCISMKNEGYINIYGRDVTQKNKDKQEMEMLSLIVQQTINSVIITDANGKVEWVNSAFEKVTGYTLQEAAGKTPGSFLQGKDTDRAKVDYIKTQVKKSEPFSCEIFNYKKSGEGYWVRINGQPIFDSEGKVIKFFAIEEDTTQAHEAEEKLKEFDKRINFALQKIGDNVWEHDFTTGHTSFSQEVYKLLGYTALEFESNANLWYNCIHPDDKKMVKTSDYQYRRGLKSDHTLQYRVIHKDGTIKWILDRGLVIEKMKDGKPAKIIGTHTNITQQKENEKELESTASRLSSLIENLNAGVLLESDQRVIKLTNTQFCNMFNLAASPEQLIGSDCSKSAELSKGYFIDPDAFTSGIEKILEDKKIVAGDRLQLVDGRFFERDFIPIWNDGRYDGHLWVYTDITEQITADKKLDEQRKFYEQILDNIPADIAVFDSSHHYLYVNPVAIKDPALRKWIVGKKDEDYIKIRNKPYSIVVERRKAFDNILASKKLNSWEEELKHPDGSTSYVFRNLYPVLNDDEKVSLVIGYGVDITNIKNIQQQVVQSEKKYRDVIENSLAIVTTHDLDGRFLTVNPMVFKLYGYKDEEVIGRLLTDFMPEEDKELFKVNYLNIINHQKEASGIYRVLHKNGNIVYSLYNNYLKEEPGKEPYVIGFAVDITDRIVAEKELKIAKKVTEELVQTKQNFMANMSHEIRTPMNAIIGMSNQLAKSSLDDTQRYYLNIIHNAADNLLIIINDILDLSKIDAGKLTLEKIAFEPKLIISRVMQVMMHRAEEKGLIFTNSFCDRRLYPVLNGDPYRLNQVLLNLLSNSIKFTEKGTVDITCSVLEDSPASQKVELMITDTGIGMDESFAKNLFNKFSQEDESVTRRFGGTGLGMSICKELVELMGGTIAVESKKGVGTKVSFSLTLEKGVAEQLQVKEEYVVNTTDFKGRRILITDDNEMNRLVASTIFENYGCIIDEAVNGLEAIEKIKANAYDIVLMDVQMPVMDGFEATGIIRKTISRDLPVIALTAFAINGDNLKCINAGMNDYLSKPFEESQLLMIASKWMAAYRAKPAGEIINTVEIPTPLYNLSSLREISKGNDNFVNKMVSMFCEQTPGAVIEMKEAYAAKDYKKLKATAHRIKPSMDTLGIQSLKDEIRQIESMAGENRESENLGTLILKLEKIVNNVVEQLLEEFEVS